MKKYVLAAVLAALPLGAQAADVVAPEAAPVASWTGGYAGLEIGYGRVGGRVEDTFCEYNFGPSPCTVSPHSNAFDVGATIGYDWQIDRSWVLGGVVKVHSVFGEDLKYYSTSFEFSELKLGHDLKALASINARAGYLADPDTLLYATSGLAMAQFQTNHWDSSQRDGSKRMFTGWDLGLGAERKLTQNVSMSLEGRYYQFGQ